MKLSTRVVAAGAMLVLSAAAIATVAPPVKSGFIPGRYIVTLNKAPAGSSLANRSIAEISQTLASQVGGRVLFVYEYALNGFALSMPDSMVPVLRLNAIVADIEQDQFVNADATQSNPPSYGLDRIDQRNLPLNQSYTYNATGAGVHAYDIDTGIRATHQDFGGRASIGYDSVGDGQNGVDCAGHGTHTAGTIGGTTAGVAKGVSIVAVRVLDCSGSGSSAGIIAGINWVTQNAIRPAVANMSLGTSTGRDTAIESAVTNSINSGVVYSVSAGNGVGNGLYAQNACNFSPAATPAALTVSATDNTDTKPIWANIGTCVDIFAPGVGIISDWYTSDTATQSDDGTSMAAPHVTGAAALYLEAHPTATAADVASALKTNATNGVVKSPGSGSPNKLLYVGFITAGGGGGPDNPPVANFTVACTNLTCTFTSTSTDDHGIASTAWAFGDSTSGNGTPVNHSYSAAGTYTVNLTVTDTVNQSNSTSKPVTVTAAGSGPCSDCTKVSGSLASGGSAYVPSATGFSSGGGTFKGYLRGGAGTDFDLYLDKKTLGVWQAVASSATTSSSEDVVYSGGSGTYRWRIKAYSGSGTYDFYYKNP